MIPIHEMSQEIRKTIMKIYPPFDPTVVFPKKPQGGQTTSL